MLQFHLFAHVELDPPREEVFVDEDGEQKKYMVQGYYQHFGVTAPTQESAERMVCGHLGEGVNVAELECEEVNFEDLPDAIREESSDPNIEGLWHVGAETQYSEE